MAVLFAMVYVTGLDYGSMFVFSRLVRESSLAILWLAFNPMSLCFAWRWYLTFGACLLYISSAMVIYLFALGFVCFALSIVVPGLCQMRLDAKLPARALLAIVIAVLEVYLRRYKALFALSASVCEGTMLCWKRMATRSILPLLCVGRLFMDGVASRYSFAFFVASAILFGILCDLHLRCQMPI